jgi:hypothetical protein
MMLSNILKFFARFPAISAMEGMFSADDAPVPGHTELYNDIKNACQQLIPDIKKFIFSQREEAIRAIVDKTDGYLMMVEYGPIRVSAPNAVGVRESGFGLSIIVAHHLFARKYDTASEALVMDQCLEYLKQIFEEMKRADADENSCPLTNWTRGSVDFAPIEPQALYQAIGWNLTITYSSNLAF